MLLKIEKNGKSYQIRYFIAMNYPGIKKQDILYESYNINHKSHNTKSSLLNFSLISFSDIVNSSSGKQKFWIGIENESS